MKSQLKNQDNLDDIYSDLSEKQDHSNNQDDDVQQKKQVQTVPQSFPLETPVQKNANPIQHKAVSQQAQQPQHIKHIQNMQPGQQPQTILMPGFGGGKMPLPPPPPGKPLNAPQAKMPPPEIQNRVQPQGVQRQRKSTIYIKNMPKSCNKQETLTKFFRTYGNIKSIKTNEEQHSAIVRFEKQQDAYRFMQTQPNILNRSYIKYNTSDDFVVPPTCIAQREKDEVVVVNASEKEVILLKQNNQTLVADKYRCMLFLMKNKDKLSYQEFFQVERQMVKCRKIRELQSNDSELGQLLQNFQNQYDWTLVYKVVTKEPIEKKKVISQFNKYGPIGTIIIKVMQSIPPTDQQSPTDQEQDKLVAIRIKHLALSSCWEMYSENCIALNIDVEGIKLNNIFKAWFVQKKQQQMRSAQEKLMQEKELFEQKENNLEDSAKDNNAKKESQQPEVKQSEAAQAFAATQEKDESQMQKKAEDNVEIKEAQQNEQEDKKQMKKKVEEEESQKEGK